MSVRTGLLCLPLTALLAVACATPTVVVPVQVGPVAPRSGEQVAVDQSIMLVDTSASIHKSEQFPGEKALLQSLVASMPNGSYEAGTTAFGGLRRDAHPLSSFDRSGLASHAAGLPYLSEGTPIHSVLAEAGAALEGKDGRAAVTLISDGSPSDAWGRDVDDATALEAAQAMAESHGGTVCVHTVQVGDDPAGAAFLQRLAAATGCGSTRLAASLSSASAIQDFQREVYMGKAEASPPLPQAAKPGDRDGDGVTDDRDECPRTPSGARADGRGCWVIRGLNFATNSAEIDPTSKRRLVQEVVPVITQNSGVQLRIDGHTDSRGAAAYNQQLSERRAQSVRDFLISQGVPASRLTARGFGEASPIAPNDTPENLRRNRRTELTVVGEE